MRQPSPSMSPPRDFSSPRSAPASPRLTRRRALASGLAAAAGALAAPALFAQGAARSPGARIRHAVVGLGRGLDHVRACLKLEGVEVACVCDVDQERLARAHAVARKGSAGARAAGDLRSILDDASIDTISIATPNHWHAPLSILALQAGKHVYVEKPGSHDPAEAAALVAAAAKHDRRVQMGNQRRSWPGIIEGIQKVREGAIGKVRFARCWYDNERPGIGRGREVPVPGRLDFDLWQGPAPARPYADNLVHYNWHWRWHWGNGELGNNGVHALDLARWGLGKDAPLEVSYAGGRYHFDDDQETPDTGVATFDFGDCGATWEHSSCHPRKPEEHEICAFYGEGGRLGLQGGGWVMHDIQGKVAGKGDGPAGDESHFQNFFDAVRGKARLNSPIDDAQRSALLCHLGNIAHRLGQTLRYDAARGAVTNAPGAAALWSRTPRQPWASLIG